MKPHIFSSAATLNIHYHVIAVDGVFSKNHTSDIRFSNVDPVTGNDIEQLVGKIATRIIRYLSSHCAIQKECAR